MHLRVHGLRDLVEIAAHQKKLMCPHGAQVPQGSSSYFSFQDVTPPAKYWNLMGLTRYEVRGTSKCVGTKKT
jgi:hypothetical protein